MAYVRLRRCHSSILCMAPRCPQQAAPTGGIPAAVAPLGSATHPAHIRRVCLHREPDGRRRTLARVFFLWPAFSGEANVDRFCACQRARLRLARYRCNQRYRCYWAPKNYSICMKPLARYQAGCCGLNPALCSRYLTCLQRVPPATNSLARINSNGCFQAAVCAVIGPP